MSSKYSLLCLEDTPNDALGHVLDLAELANQKGLSGEFTSAPTNRSRITVNKDGLDVKPAGRLLGRAVVAKEVKGLS